MEKFNKLLKLGKEAQLQKLIENDHKQGFEDMPIHDAFILINEKMHIISKEIYERYDEWIGQVIPEDQLNLDIIQSKLADIANFAHMGILTCNKLKENTDV